MAKSSNKNIKKINAQLNKSSTGKKTGNKKKNNTKYNSKNTNYKKTTSKKVSTSNVKNAKRKYTRKKKPVSKVVLEKEKKIQESIEKDNALEEIIKDYTLEDTSKVEEFSFKEEKEDLEEKAKELEEDINNSEDESLSLQSKVEEIVEDITSDYEESTDNDQTDNNTDVLIDDNTVEAVEESNSSLEISDDLETTKYDELVDELRSLYDNDSDLKDTEKHEVIITDYEDNNEENNIVLEDNNKVKYSLGDKIFKWIINILYATFVLLVIALIVLIVYVCTY